MLKTLPSTFFFLIKTNVSNFVPVLSFIDENYSKLLKLLFITNNCTQHYAAA